MYRLMATGFVAAMSVLASGETASAQTIVAHRGASDAAPENTLAAFREAWNQEADAIEGDFHLTKDGHIVCIHDKDTQRTSGGAHRLKIAQSTLEELRSIDVGSWKNERFAGERIPLLDEVLATVPRTGAIFVEIKCGPEIIEPLRVVLEKSNLRPEQVVIISFDEAVITQSRKRMPQYKANWLTGYKEKGGELRPTLETVVETLERTGATGLGTAAKDEVVTADFVKSIRDAGVECHVWTVNQPLQARRYADLGFDSITTDKPAVIRQALLSGVAE